MPRYPKPVEGLKDGKWYKFDSIHIASVMTGISRSAIQNSLDGRSVKAGGYEWKYQDVEK